MKAAIYLRVSSPEQGERETPIAAQREACLKWASESGYTVPKRWIIEDRGYSGAEEGRPGLQRLLAAAQDNPPFKAIIALDNTRFSRSEELFYWLRREFRTCGVEMLSATEHGEIELLTGVKAIIGAEQRRQIAVRTKLAMDHIARQGLRCGGRAPYGYKRKELPSHTDNKPVTLVADPEQAPILKRLFRMRAKGASLRDLAYTLNAEGIPGPTSKGWRAGPIADMLRNPVYIGCAVYGRSKKVSRNPSRSVKVPREKWQVIEGAHKALVDRATWKTVQETFREGSPSKKTTYVIHPLSGLIYCGLCGSTYQLRGGRGGAYACSKRKEEGPQACSNKRVVGKRALEERVNGLVLEALEWPDNAEAVYQAIKRRLLRKRQEAKSAHRATDAVKVRAEIRKAEVGLQRLLGVITREGTNAPRTIVAEIERLERRIAALETELLPPAKIEVEPPTEEEIRRRMELIAEALRKGSPEKRREVYRSLIRRIVISPKTTRIEGNPQGGAFPGRARLCRGRDTDGLYRPGITASWLAGWLTVDIFQVETLDHTG